MIETTTIRFAPAAAPARWRFCAEVVKNAVAASWSGEGPVAVSMMVWTPASAASRPPLLTTSTPLERAIGTTSCPRCSRISDEVRSDPAGGSGDGYLLAPVFGLHRSSFPRAGDRASGRNLICNSFDTRRREQ